MLPCVGGVQFSSYTYWSYYWSMVTKQSLGVVWKSAFFEVRFLPLPSFHRSETGHSKQHYQPHKYIGGSSSRFGADLSHTRGDFKDSEGVPYQKRSPSRRATIFLGEYILHIPCLSAANRKQRCGGASCGDGWLPVYETVVAF